MAPHVEHSEIVRFGNEVVNLHQDRVRRYRKQVNDLRDRLAAKIRDNPDFSLVKMLHSGSVAKGTALSSINDMDVAVYVRKSDAPGDDSELLDWLADRLREANPNMHPEQFNPGTHCVSVNFRGTGLDVDVVPVLYEDDPDDRGYLLNRDDGTWLETSVRLHLEFIRKRKRLAPQHFSQVIRLLKWWVRLKKSHHPDFRFKSFMVELLCAHMLDNGANFKDYPKILQEFFSFIVQSQLKMKVAFTDYYPSSSLPKTCSSPVSIFDPVNGENNVADNYSDHDRITLVEGCADALDALTEAQFSDTKGRAVSLWKEVLGPSFRV